ncbi:ubiqitin hydrolase, putative [Leishmania donovani]|uniref:Cysteine peptidase, Clan CA, family C19, putative n=2 Tax=Leishmania donovani TaxID=5661 RepID=E9B9S8_LEIDO|nr:ubiqitin hydrolase, putative [Leishmania donovani]AYU76466.1 cysteine peptidase, Clan CA, family C19, putative [Leishmania donovani]CBZ32001.1 ubiqitin hydrolase, putative [Leishmania donovani]
MRLRVLPRCRRTITSYLLSIMSATAASSRRKQHHESLKEESMISFEMELDEAIELPLDVSAVAPTDAALSAPLGGKKITMPAARAASESRAAWSNGSTASLRFAVCGNGKELPNTPATADGVGSPIATPDNAATTTYSAAAPSRTLTWKDTSASQRRAEAQASRQDDFNPMVLCPLQNLGNTCYFNAGVQLLVNCPALVYAVRNSPFAQSTQSNGPLTAHAVSMPRAEAATATTKLCLKGGAATHTLFQEFSTLLARMEMGCAAGERAISPICALDSLAQAYPQFEGRSQQDAAEMMTSLLASLEEEGGQYVEVAQLLQSFEEDAAALRQGVTSLASSPRASEPVARALKDATAPLLEAETAPSASPHRRDYSEPCNIEEYSQPSLLSSTSEDTFLPGPRSAHFFTVLRLMERVNRENELLERRVKQRQGIAYTNSFKPPRLHFNPLLDGFRGYTLSEVECHNCRAVSRVVSPFNGLLLDVPTAKQRRRYALAHPNVPRRVDFDGQLRQVKKPFRLTWWNPLSLCVAAWRQLKRFFQDPFPYPLWLDECLDIHFEPEVLRGCNRYRCESCDTTTDATKSETLLALPEYLLIHMKRFEAGRFFNSKKSDSVFFPTSWRPLTKMQARQSPINTDDAPPALPEYLDLRHYLHSSVAPFAEPIPPCLWSTGNEPHQQHHASRDDASSPASSIATTYTLDGIVNHHGGYDGGHYTVFLYKATEERQAWVYISDDEVEQAEEVVATDTEYVLLYRRQPLVQAAPESDEAEQLRRKACYYLSQSSPSCPAPNTAAATTAGPKSSKLHNRCPFSSSSAGGAASAPPHAATAATEPWVYISRMWLQRVVFMHEPGPIVNRLCYCRPEDQGRVSMYRTIFPATVKVPAEVPHVHGPPVSWFYVPITQRDYDIFYNAFGGNAAVTASEYESLRAMQGKFCAAIDLAERQRGSAARPAPRR